MVDLKEGKVSANLAALTAFDTAMIGAKSDATGADIARAFKESMVAEFGSLELATIPEDMAKEMLLGVSIQALLSTSTLLHPI